MKTIILVGLIATIVFGQSNIPDIVSSYYNGALFKGTIDRITVRNAIDYPGYFKDTALQYGIGLNNHSIALQPQGFTTSNSYFPYIVAYHNNFSFSDLSGFGEIRVYRGTLGIWIGDMYGNDNENSSAPYNVYKDKEASMKCAVWYTTALERGLKGVSLTLDHQRFDNETTRQTSPSVYYDTDIQNSASRYFNTAATALFSIAPQLHLKISCIYNQGEGHYVKTDTTFSYSSTNYNNKYYDLRSKGLQFYCGLLDAIGKQANIGFCASPSNSDTALHFSYYNQDSSYLREIGHGTSEFFINYSFGKTYNYVRHVVYYGLFTQLNDAFPFNGSNVVFKDAVSKINRRNQILSLTLQLPIAIDLNLFNTNHFAVFRINPTLLWARNIGDFRHAYPRSFSVNIDNFALGIKGKITDRLEYFVVPSIQSNIFFTGLEMLWLFGSTKP